MSAFTADEVRVLARGYPWRHEAVEEAVRIGEECRLSAAQTVAQLDRLAATYGTVLDPRTLMRAVAAVCRR